MIVVGKLRPITFFEGENEEKKVESKTGNDLVYFKNCKNSKYSISKTCTKIIIEGCSECSFEIFSNVLTKTLELINCNKIIVSINSNLFTVTADKCNMIHFKYSNKSLFNSIVSSQSLSIGLSLSKEEVVRIGKLHPEIKEVSEIKDFNQYITHFVEDKIETEEVIREGGKKK